MIKRLLYHILLILTIAVIFVPLHAYSSENDIVDVAGVSCMHGLKKIQNTPYAVMMFCEGALGNYLSITYVGWMSAPVDGTWSLNNRHRQNEAWGLDVTSYFYDPPTFLLYIATSELYGEGGIYRLNLHNKKFRKLTFDTEKEGKEFKLKSIDHKRRRLNYKVIKDGNVKKIASIPLVSLMGERQ